MSTEVWEVWKNQYGQVLSLWLNGLLSLCSKSHCLSILALPLNCVPSCTRLFWKHNTKPFSSPNKPIPVQYSTTNYLGIKNINIFLRPKNSRFYSTQNTITFLTSQHLVSSFWDHESWACQWNDCNTFFNVGKPKYFPQTYFQRWPCYFF